MIIYKATNLVNGKIYIGKTIRRLVDRMRQHLHQNADGIFSRAIKKYGQEAFRFIAIDNAEDITSLNEKEAYWIRHYHSKCPNGYNLTDGGEGIVGCPRSEETKARLRAFNKGKKLSKEHKAKISQSQLGKFVSCESRERMRAAQTGKHLSRETKIKMGIARSGDKNGSAKLTWDDTRKIRQLHSTGRFTQQMLADLYGVSRGSIRPIIHNAGWIERNA